MIFNQETCYIHHFCLEVPSKPCIQHETPFLFSYCYIHPFCYTILLWCLAYCEVYLDQMLLPQLYEFWIYVLSIIIWPETFDLSSCLIFYFCFSYLKLDKCFWLISHEIHPNLSCIFINENHEIYLSSTWC